MGPPTCSSSSMCIDPGARSKSPTTVPRWTSPPACANSPTLIFLKRSAFGSYWTTCRRTSPDRSTRPSPLSKRDGCCAGWSSIMSPSTPVGSTWSRSRLACCEANAWTGASPPRNSSYPRSPPGSDSAMPHAPASNGCSLLRKPEPKWAAPTPNPPPSASPGPKSHNHCAAVLVGIPVDEERIAKPGPDGEHRPFLDVLHGGHLAQPLYHRVVVHHDRGFELPNLGNGLKQRNGKIESTAFPISGQA